MNKKHYRTLEAIFKTPVQSNVIWKDIRLLSKLHLLAKIALFGIFFGKFFDRMFTYALKIFQKIYTKIANFFKQSKFRKKSIEKLFVYLGAQIKEGDGSRLAVELNGIRAYFHRPHPQKETDKGTLVSARKFLENAGVKPC